MDDVARILLRAAVSPLSLKLRATIARGFCYSANMASAEEVKKLAALARIRVSEEELPKFTHEFDAVLAYVGQLEKLDLPRDLKPEKPPLHNVMRTDEHPTPAGTNTEKLVAAFPEREGDYLVVKQIITHD